MLTSKWGNVSARLEMDCWRERYVEVESVIIGSVHHALQNDVFVRFKSRIANSVVLNISIIGHYSIELTTRQVILTVCPSNGLAIRALQQPRVAEVL